MTSIAAFQDRYGLPISTHSRTAAELYVEGIDRTLAAQAGAEDHLRRAVEADEGFALGQIALARAEQFRGQIAGARARAARTRALAENTTPRERGHVAAVAAAIEGNPAAALDLTRAHLKDFPRDAFVLSQVNGVYSLIGFSGRQDRNQEQLDLLDSVAPAYGDDWWFLSAHAFAYNELFQQERARALVERSLALYPRNAHGAHTAGHVFFETGDNDGGAAFLSSWMPGYDQRAQLHCHLSWHWALFELARGNYDRVMALYDENISPRVTGWNTLTAVADGASLLWRCDLHGAYDRLPWDEVRAHAAAAYPRAGVTWADVHCAIAYAGAGDEAALSALIDGLREREAQGRQPAGPVAVRLALGIAAFRHGDFEETIRQIEPVAGEVVRIGGSHAQREVFEDTLIEACLRAGHADKAEALLRERLGRRPSPRDFMLAERARAGLG